MVHITLIPKHWEVQQSQKTVTQIPECLSIVANTLISASNITFSIQYTLYSRMPVTHKSYFLFITKNSHLRNSKQEKTKLYVKDLYPYHTQWSIVLLTFYYKDRNIIHHGWPTRRSLNGCSISWFNDFIFLKNLHGHKMVQICKSNFRN